MKKKLIPVIAAIVLIIITIVATYGMKVIEKYSYSKERANLFEYFNISGNETAIMFQDEILEQKAKVVDNIVYLEFNMVQEYFNDRFYYDTKEGYLLYTGPTETVTNIVGTNSYSSMSETVEVEYPISIAEDENLYIAIEYLKKYTNLSYELFDNPSRIQIDNQWSPRQIAEIKKDTAVRVLGGIKSEVLKDLEENETVIILEKMENWSKVKTSDSLIGYVENKRLINERTKEPEPIEEVQEQVFSNLTRDYKINLVWHQVTNATANTYLADMMVNASGVNVISPTWFSLIDNEGNFSNLASTEYVNQAHAMGLEVWGLIDNFSPDISTKEILSYTSKRTYLIQNLVNTAKEYGIDGINLDFESLAEDTGEDFIQFVRELSVACRANSLVLSVDNYVPKEYSAHYHRKEQGIFADYLIIMGYDEHYAGGNKAGSVASINFVEEGIANTIQEVPANKVINAVPFYTRIWSTTGTEIKADSVAMGVAESFMTSRGAEISWDEETCQNYAEVNKENTLYQVWFEDAASIEVKLNIMRKYSLGGVAAWKLGLETQDIWPLLNAYVSE